MADLQDLCELGQQQLERMDYLSAEATLVQAEQLAVQLADFDTLGRLYMPLQETRRQRRQRCGEGTVRLDLIAADSSQLLDSYPHGQLLIAGMGTIQPAVEFRKLQQERRLFVETFLAAAYPTSAGDTPRVIVIVPTPDVQLPPPTPRSVDRLLPLLPAHSIVLSEAELPHGDHPGTPETYARTMAMWEQLHAPFLAVADMEIDPLKKMDAYRKAIRVDYACELAHQKLSDTARNYARQLMTNSNRRRF